MLQELRKRQGLSQSQLAKKANVSLSSLQHYEQGDKDIRKAQAETVLKIARALDTTMEQIIE